MRLSDVTPQQQQEFVDEVRLLSLNFEFWILNSELLVNSDFWIWIRNCSWWWLLKFQVEVALDLDFWNLNLKRAHYTYTAMSPLAAWCYALHCVAKSAIFEFGSRSNFWCRISQGCKGILVKLLRPNEQKGSGNLQLAISKYSRLAIEETSIQAISHYKRRFLRSHLNFCWYHILPIEVTIRYKQPFGCPPNVCNASPL